MLPFGDEPEETNLQKPLSFLSFGSADRNQKRKPPRSSIFGNEPAEQEPQAVKSRSTEKRVVPKRPFEDEVDEIDDPPPSKAARGKRAHMVSAFGDEGSEDEFEHNPRPKTAVKPFQDEGCETDGSSSATEGGFVVKQPSVFSFGWSSVSTFQKATFWRENMDDPKASKQKRAYDNTKRSAGATYSRQASKGAYKRNGLDPARLQKLFDSSKCLCVFVWIRWKLYFPVFRVVFRPRL